MKNHYEKVVCACCFLALFVNVGLNSTSFAVYQPYIVAVPGVGDAGGSAVVALRVLVSLVVTVFVDRYYNALDLRVGVSVATVLTAAGFFVYGFAADLPLFLLGAVTTGAAYGFGGMVATTMLVNRWFKSGIGTVVGVASVGSGVAGIVVPVAAARIIEGHSLSWAFRFEGLLALAVAVVIFAFLRNRPSDLGLAPHEGEGASSSQPKGRSIEGVRLTSRERVLVLAALAMTGAFSMGGIAYLSILFVASGVDAGFAAFLLSVTGICLTASKFVTGELFDRIGTRLASGIMFAVLVAGLVLCCAVPIGPVGIAIAAAICVGAGVSLGSVGLSVWSLELAEPEARVRSIKNCQLAYSAGGFVMNVLPGPLKELTGTYVTSYAIMAVLAATAAAIILFAYRPRPSGASIV